MKKSAGILASALALVIVIAGIGILIDAHQDKPAIAERPFLCLVPYNLEYCHANQDKMYAEQAQRERGIQQNQQ